MAVESDEMLPVVAANVALMAAAGTVTDAGIVSAVAVLESATTAPPVPATWDNVTVQVADALGPRLVGVQESDDSAGVAVWRLIDAVFELPLKVAVMTAVWLAVMVPAVAVKVALVAAA